MKEKTVCLRTGKNVRQLAHRLADYWSDEEELRCELLRTADGTYVVQGEDRGNDLDACHLAGRTAMVWFTADGEDRVLAVIRPGKKRGTGGALAFGLLLQWGLAFLALYGMLRQARLLRRTARFLRRELSEDMRPAGRKAAVYPE